MTYKILFCPSIKQLEIQVNEALKEGWTPQGGICLISVSLVAQAMIKTVINKDNK